jgi:hypothetical protein
MATGAPGTYRLDEMGREREKPRPAGALTPLQRIIGPVASVIEPPTQKQEQAQGAAISEQFSSMYQQYPELRPKLLEELRRAAGRYKPPQKVLRPRRG